VPPSQEPAKDAWVNRWWWAAVDSNHLPPRCWAPSGLLSKLGGRSKCAVLSGVVHVRYDLLQTSDVDLVAASTWFQADGYAPLQPASHRRRCLQRGP